MKKTYNYNVSVHIDTLAPSNIISWDDTFSRDDVKGFFSPKENIYYDLLYLPELFTSEEVTTLTPEVIAENERKAQEAINNFQFEVILNDCLDIWLHDLTQDFQTEVSKYLLTLFPAIKLPLHQLIAWIKLKLYAHCLLSSKICAHSSRLN